MFSYEGKRVLVTGAGRGIGRAIALAMARQGADVCLSARSEAELEEVATRAREDHARRAWVLPADLSDARRTVEVVRRAVDAMGGLDVLVNNAGGGSSIPGGLGPLEEATLEGLRSVYALNLEAPFFAALEAVKAMKAGGRGGCILNIASIDGVFPAPGVGVYGSAKAALVSLTESMAVEMGCYKVRVNAIAPSLIETRLVAQQLATPEQRRTRASFFPLNRVGQPEDVAGAATFLCSDEAGWISGVTLLVAGGQQATSGVLPWVRSHNLVPETARS